MASFRKLSSGWQYRISYKVGNGYRQKEVSGFKTKGEARAAAAEMEVNLKRGARIDKGTMLFTDYMQNWFDTFRKGKRSVRNDEDVELSIRYAKQYFVGVQMKDMGREIYQKALNDYAQTHSVETVRKRHMYVKKCLQYAMQDGTIFKDPTFEAQIFGKVKPKSEDNKYISYMEAKRISLYFLHRLDWRYVSRHMILFALATGCRFAEIKGLTWDCVDTKKGLVRISKTWDSRIKKDFAPTKNEASKRVITIDRTTCRWLDDLKKQQDDLFQPAGIENNLVFVNEKCQLIDDGSANTALKHACVRFKINPITMHGLRHTHASILLYQGVSIAYVSRRLGHANINTTMRIYAHILDELSQRESEASQRVVDGLFEATN